MWDCPPELLPWLAWALSVDLWDEEWSVERKRRVIANSFHLHRLKGTAAGLKKYVSLVDAEVKQILIPPQGAFASAAISKGELDAWLRTMPQIRVYLAREVGSGRGLSFIARDHVDHAFARFDAGRALLGRAARIWDNGVETRVRISDLTTEREEKKALRIERVSIPGNAGPGAFVGRYADRYFVGVSVSEAKLVTYRQDVNYEHRFSTLSLKSAVPSLNPVDVRSERLSDTGHAGANAFVKRYVGHVFLGEDMAPWMMYDRIVLHDPSRAVPRAIAWSFAGTARLGLPPFTAKTVVDLKDKMPKPAAAVGRFVDSTYAIQQNTKKQSNVRLAIRTSKAVRDKILVTHKLTRQHTFEDGIPLDGSFKFGARVPFRL